MATDITPITVDQAISAADVVRFFETGGGFDIAQLVEDPEVVAARITERILKATSAAELFGESQTIKGREYVGKPFQLQGVDWRPSDIEGEGLPFYAVLHVVDLEGEVHAISIGAKQEYIQPH